MKKRSFFILLFLIGTPFVAYAIYEKLSDTVFFYQNGIPKEAVVINLINISHQPKGPNTYIYSIMVEGNSFVQRFYYNFPAGDSIDVLVSPNNKSTMVLGKAEDSIFTILEYMLGGKLLALGILFMIPILLFSPKIIWDLMFNPNKCLKKANN